MSAIRVVKTVTILAIAAGRNPAVRAAIKAAPSLVTPEGKQAAVAGAKKAARKAGELTARIVPPNRFF